MNASKKPISVWILIGLLIFLSFGGFLGGIMFLLDPSGIAMGLPPGLLDTVPFIDNFILPAFFLILVMGIAPLGIAFGLWQQKQWAWKTAVILSIVLIGWILFQILLWGMPAAIQVFYLIFGIILLILCFIPAVRRYASG